MADDLDLFEQLPVGEFNGVVFAVISCTLTHSSAAAYHKFPHRPGQLIELTGREPITGTMEVALFNSLRHFRGGANKVQWPGTAQSLREAAQSQRLGKLTIPPYGVLPRAKIKYTEKYDPSARNGCFATIEFTEDSRDLIAKGGVNIGNGLDSSDVFGALAAERGAAGLALARMQIPTAAGFVSLFDAIGQLRTGLAEMQQDLTAPLRLAQSISYELDKLLKSASEFRDALNWDATDILLTLKDSVDRCVEEAAQGFDDIKRYVAPALVAMGDIASATGNTLDELVRLNPGVPINEIDPGTILIVLVK